MTMKKLALLFGLLFVTPAFAADNAVIVTPGTGVTMKSKDIGAGVQAMQPILSDASGNTLLTTAGADAVSNTLTGIPVYSRQLFYNGTTWDRWQGAVTATLAAETTKVIGTVRVASGGIASGSIAAGALAAGACVDGCDLTQGAIGDAAVVGGATGSISAKLRAISRDILTLTTQPNANGRAVSSSSSPVVPSAAPTTWHLIAAASTNATSVKNSAATLFSCQLGGIGSAPAYLKIYNKASAPTVGTDTPVKTLIIPAASTAANGAGSNITFGPGGLTLGTGFAAAVTGAITDADTTSVAAATFAINCDYE